MTSHHRSRRLAVIALTAAIASALGACGTAGPNSTLTPHSEFGREIDHLFNILFVGGIVVFVLVEAALLFTILKYRRREGAPAPKHVHGNTTLEITWTLIPAVVLAFIAIPTVRTIFRTQARALPNALQVEVIGHQWWWEFRYPEYGIVTANELYLPVGRTVNFALTSRDVIHSFWVPQLGGKRDAVTNHTNHIWFTPETEQVWNGFCAEYCGTSHANMRFRAFTVSPEEFDRWVAHQRSGPAFTAPAAAASPPGGGTGAPVQLATGTVPLDQLPDYAVPSTPIPAGLEVTGVEGDPARGAQLYRTGACIACHVVQGVSPGVVGPNLTHFGSRTTLAAGLYPNDERHLRAWIKNAPRMKPGSLMPALGRGQAASGGYTDQQIADIAAYLLSLK